jgi:hypothetical protein
MLIIKTTNRDGKRAERLINSDSRYLLQVHYCIDNQRMSIADYDGNTEFTYYMTINQWHKVREWFENGYSTTVVAYTYPMDEVSIAQAQHKLATEDNTNFFN